MLAALPPGRRHGTALHAHSPHTIPTFAPKQVEELKQQNKELREQVITTAAAPPDPYAGELEGELMRRSRTGPF